MLIDNVSGAFTSRGVEWPGGPGLYESTSASGTQGNDFERLGPDGVTWILIAKTTGNVVVNFDFNKSQVRIVQGAGTNVFADVSTRRFSP